MIGLGHMTVRWKGNFERETEFELWQIRESCGQELHVLQVRNQATTQYNSNITIEPLKDHSGCVHKKFTGAINSKRAPQNSAESVTNFEIRPRAKGAVSLRRATHASIRLSTTSSLQPQ